MISLGPRYLDYGLTGGFFLFLALALFGSFDTANAVAAFNALRDFLSKNELKGFETLLNGVFASLFVVCVFATGLILDLTGSVLIAWEADVFRRYLERNKGWVEPLLAKYHEYLGEDFCQFLTYPPVVPRNWKDVKAQLAFRALRLLPQMRRIESILLAHLLLVADREKIEFVLDQVRTCRLARAVSSGTYVVSMGFYFFVTQSSGVQRPMIWPVIWLGIAMILSTFIVRRAYSKLCSNLFSTLLVLTKQPAVDRKKGKHDIHAEESQRDSEL